MHVGPVHAYDQNLQQHLGDTLFALEDRTQVWIREIKSMGPEVWTRYGIGSMNRARSGTRSCRSIYTHNGPEARGMTELASDLNSLAGDNFEWASWSSGGAPAKIQFSLARAAQCAPNGTGNSPYDLTHGIPELLESSGSCPSPHPAPVWPCMGFRVPPKPPLGRMTITYTSATHIIRGKRAESEL